MESRTLPFRPTTQKKYEAKDQLLESRSFRGQGLECSRPRTSKCVLEAKDVFEDSTSAYELQEFQWGHAG